MPRPVPKAPCQGEPSREAAEQVGVQALGTRCPLVAVVVRLEQFQLLTASFTGTACLFPTESEARALAKERQKKDNHNLSKSFSGRGV